MIMRVYAFKKTDQDLVSAWAERVRKREVTGMEPTATVEQNKLHKRRMVR